MKKIELLTRSTAKMDKALKLNVLNCILHLAPATVAGLGDVCHHASPACRAACIHYSGRAAMIKKGENTNTIIEARKRKTKLFFQDNKAFMAALFADIARQQNYAAKKCMALAIRLNGTSDIPWEKIRHDGKSIFDLFPDVQFYDYTKNPDRLSLGISNYHVTFSRSEINETIAHEKLLKGHNVAIVFAGKRLPEKYTVIDNEMEFVFDVINGDEHDLRHLDPRGVVVGLTAKGKGKKDTSGFVVAL